jgi:hypothetical protein
MSATVGVNSYVTVAEATAYFAARYGFSAWPAEAAKDAALVSATQVLDNYAVWFGDKVDESQLLAFPRDPDANPVPQEIKDSQCEIAYLITRQGSASQTPEDALSKLVAGSVELEFKALAKGNPVVNTLVDSMLAPYGVVKGSGSTKQIPIYRC